MGSDIYLELNGNKIALIANYNAKEVDNKYHIVLWRVYPTDYAIKNSIEFDSLQDFCLVVVKPDKIIKYSECKMLHSPRLLLYSGGYEDVEIISNARKERNILL